MPPLFVGKNVWKAWNWRYAAAGIPASTHPVGRRIDVNVARPRRRQFPVELVPRVLTAGAPGPDQSRRPMIPRQAWLSLET
jgi:hypothetical protein